MLDKIPVRVALDKINKYKNHRELSSQLFNCLRKSDNNEILINLCNAANIQSKDLLECLSSSYTLFSEAIENLNRRVDNTYLAE